MPHLHGALLVQCIRHLVGGVRVEGPVVLFHALVLRQHPPARIILRASTTWQHDILQPKALSSPLGGVVPFKPRLGGRMGECVPEAAAGALLSSPFVLPIAILKPGALCVAI